MCSLLCDIYIYIWFALFGQEDCSQQDSSPDEPIQRSADLDDLDDVDVNLEDPLADEKEDDLSPANYYMAKSLNRYSRMDTPKVGHTTFLLT